jgi:hypothetical protein
LTAHCPLSRIRDLVPSSPIAMSRGGTIRLAAVSGAAVLLISWGPPAHASGGTGSGSGNACNPVAGGQVGATNPVAISANATVNCPMVSGPTGVPYGNSQSRGSVSRGTPAQPCQYLVERPTKVQVTGPNSALQMDADYTGTKYGGFSYPSYMALYPVQVAAKYNVFTPYLFTGKYDANGQCTVPVGGNIAPGWQLGCPNPIPFYNIVVAGNLCNTEYPNAVVRPGGMNPGAVVPYLDRANLLQYINIGKVSSMPDNPNKGLVNIGTCFFIDGANFTVPGGGPPQPVLQPITYEMSVSEPVNDGTGRFVFYVFRITVALQGIDWDFGDHDPTYTTQLPAPCTNGAHDIAVSHTYTRYGDYQVQVIEHYGATVDEYWSDADGEHHRGLGNLLAVPPQQLPGYPKSILQEVGVPTTNG